MSVHSVVYSDVYNASCVQILLSWNGELHTRRSAVLFYLQSIFVLYWELPVFWSLAIRAVSVLRKYCLGVESDNLSVCTVYS
jgi:hypothetical protein